MLIYPWMYDVLVCDREFLARFGGFCWLGQFLLCETVGSDAYLSGQPRRACAKGADHSLSSKLKNIECHYY